MEPGSRTLRSQLLRWLLVPLSLLFIVDAIGSYFLARHLSNDVYDGELMEIARELNLHVKVAEARPTFDLEADAERALLLDQYDDVFYAVRAADGALIAGDAELPRDGRAKHRIRTMASRTARACALRNSAPTTATRPSRSRWPRRS